jgi:Flp pilus assembly protein TadG
MSRRARRLQGQVLVLLLPLLAVLGAAAWWAFEAGQVVTEKQRLRDAADAAALSGAVWQTRALNFDSTLNRAIIANEAVIAQSVSLRSWSAYMNRLLPTAAVLTSYVPYLNTATVTLQRWWAGFDRALQPSLTGLESLTGGIDHTLAAAQRTMHLATLAIVPEIVRTTISETDPRFRLSAGGEAQLLAWAADWQQFSSFYGGAWRWRQQDVVYRSLDGFTAQRNFTLRPLLGTDVLRFEKRAGTELLDFETWRAIDTLSIHQPRYVVFGSMRERTPVSWGGAENGAGSRLRGAHGDAWRRNPRAARAAEQSIVRQSGYRGLPSLYDLSAAQRSRFDPPRIIVRVRLPAESRRGAAALLGFERVVRLTGAEVELADNVEETAGAMFAEAAASTEFLRLEPRRDGARELPSLYSPYWRSTLAALTLADRLSLAIVDGTPPWLAGVPR